MSNKIEKIKQEAAKGNLDALYQLGFAYYTGKNIEPDMNKAIECFRKSANQGHVQSIQALGVCYANGDGVAKDLEKAVFWYQKGADLGFDQSKYNLALCYYRGEGVPQNEAIGKVLMEEAAETDVDAKRFIRKVYKKSFLSRFRRSK